MLRSELPIWWAAGLAGATLLVLCLIALNARRRRGMLPEDEATRAALPTLREDVLWGALVLVSGGAGLPVIFWLVANWHTARALLAGAIFGCLMVLGLVMLLKNGLAPTDILRLDEAEPEAAEAPASSPDELAPEEARWRIHPGV